MNPWGMDWTKETVAVVAGGPSVTPEDLNLVRRFNRAVVVNSSYKKVPWADILYATDYKWWKYHAGARDFNGLKMCSAGKGVEKEWPDIFPIMVPHRDDPRRPTIIFEPWGLVGTGGNSGFQLLNIVVQLGARRIALLGFDFNLNGGTHHHGDHPAPLHNPDFEVLDSWRQKLDGQAFRLKARGISVVNCSPTSSLQNFRRVSVADILKEWAPCSS